MYGLSAQLRRAAVSIPANIAEGFRRRGMAEKVRFMNIAEGSIEECRYFLVLANDLGYGERNFESVARPRRGSPNAVQVLERHRYARTGASLLTPFS